MDPSAAEADPLHHSDALWMGPHRCSAQRGLPKHGGRPPHHLAARRLLWLHFTIEQDIASHDESQLAFSGSARFAKFQSYLFFAFSELFWYCCLIEGSLCLQKEARLTPVRSICTTDWKTRDLPENTCKNMCNVKRTLFVGRAR